MDKKRVIGLLLLIFSMIILFWENNNLMIGNVIGNDFSFSIMNLVGFILLIGSFILLLSNKTLDKLVIPGEKMIGKSQD